MIAVSVAVAYLGLCLLLHGVCLLLFADVAAHIRPGWHTLALPVATALLGVAIVAVLVRHGPGTARRFGADLGRRIGEGIRESFR